MNPMDLFNQVKDMIEKKDFEAAKNLSMTIKMIWANTSTKLNLLFQATKWLVELQTRLKVYSKTRSPQSY